MWSAMLLAAALPGRSMIDSGSPSEVAHSIGWNPNPALKCAAAPALFSECTSTSVESDATRPNSTGWARRCSMSLHASPPPASINNA